MRESQVVAGKKTVGNFLLIDFWRELIRDQHHNHVAVERSFGGVLDYKPGGLGFLARRAVSPETDDHIAARVLQVVGVGVSLRSVADHRDLPRFEMSEIGVLVVINLHSISCEKFVLRAIPPAALHRSPDQHPKRSPPRAW